LAGGGSVGEVAGVRKWLVNFVDADLSATVEAATSDIAVSKAEQLFGGIVPGKASVRYVGEVPNSHIHPVFASALSNFSRSVV
jgi:hypothetical protein